MTYKAILSGSFVDNVLNEKATNKMLDQQDRGETLPTDQQEMQKHCMNIRNNLQRKFEQQN